MERTLTLEANEKVGKKIRLNGWVQTVRDHGKVAFVMLEDRAGVIQGIKVDGVGDLSEGDVVEVIGSVKERPEKMHNENIETGKIELEIGEIKILNKSKELPIPIDNSGHDINEEMRLRYRYLDLRRPRLKKIMKLRSDYIASVRKQLSEHGFTEVETPMLTKATKEGARDFIVPSRFNPGKFYALPQSPQQYKQLLMTAGVERYFQFARCIRDEDLRADRGYEHTQIDLEMSFMTQEEVMSTVEDIITNAVKAVGANIKEEPFPRVNYKDALEKYGNDKFDLRDEKEKEENVLAFAWVVNFPFFKKVDQDDAAETKDSRSGWVFTHNPFSNPIPEHLEWHMKGENIGEIVTAQYDLVCNGLEIGGGSIRAHDPEVLKQTFKIMGYSDEEIGDSIGHMLEAFELGTPPHGGIGMGLDRHVMILAGEQSLKETIAFPMTSTGKTAVMDAPSTIPKEDLDNLGLEFRDKGTTIVNNIVDALENAGIDHKFIEHEPVRTSEEAAKVRGTKLSEGAKAMILLSKEYDNKYFMVVIPADRQLDLQKTSTILGEEVRVAKAEEVEAYTGVQVGGVPPFGRILGMDLYYDRSMYNKERSAFNCGRKDRSIIISTKDLIRAAQPDKRSPEYDFLVD